MMKTGASDGDEIRSKDDVQDLKAPHSSEPISISDSKPKRKRESPLRKAPGAPKRFKSSYILFFMAHREEIKVELGQNASVSVLMFTTPYSSFVRC